MRISDLMQNATKPFFSVEFFPPADDSRLAGFFHEVDELVTTKPLFASVTYGAGGSKQQNTLKIARAIQYRGVPTMAHLTCVGASSAAIKDYLGQLNQNGINNVLALRGDIPKNKNWDWKDGDFRYASELAGFIRAENPAMGIGVAAYPFPHPESPTFESDREFTSRKLANGAADFAITQLFFDNREYVELVENLRKRGITTPVIPGIITIQSFEGIKRLLSLCGVHIPVKFYMDLEEAQKEGGPEAVRETGLKFAINQIRQLLDYGAPGVHLYTLNKSGLCKRIISETGLG